MGTAPMMEWLKGLEIISFDDVARWESWLADYDEAFFLQKYSPRRPRSSWSKVNVEKVETLIAAGRMEAPGLAEVSLAKADGRWDTAYESQRNATIPPDLAAAVDQNERARSRFDALGKTERYAVILRLLKARGPADRVARLRKELERLVAEARIE